MHLKCEKIGSSSLYCFVSLCFFAKLTKLIADSLLDLFILKNRSPSFNILVKRMEEIEGPHVHDDDLHARGPMCGKRSFGGRTLKWDVEIWKYVPYFHILSLIGPID